MGPWEKDGWRPWQQFAQRTLSSSSEQCSTSGSGTSDAAHAASDSTMWDGLQRSLMRRGAPFAAVSSPVGPRKKKKSVSPEGQDAPSAAGDEQPQDIRDVMREAAAQLTPEQQEQLRNRIIVEKMKKRRVRVGGKRTNLYKLAREIVEERKLQEAGAGEPQIRQESRWLADARIPGPQLRPWAHKMQLRPAEEAALELDLFARGQHFSPHPLLRMAFGGRRDFAFGIYGKADAARELLKEKYAGRLRDEVIMRQGFYEDMLDNAHTLGLTLMAVAARPLPLASMRDGLLARVRIGMQQAPDHPALISEELPPPEDDAELEFLRSSVTEEALRPFNVLDKKGNLRTGTQIILSTRPNADLWVEAISPDRLRDRQACLTGPFKSPLLTRATMGLALGPFPLDFQAKVQAGQAVLYVTNGFKLGYDPGNKNQVFSGLDGRPEFPKPRVEALEASPELFSLEGSSKRAPRLLQNIQQGRTVRLEKTH